MEVKVEIEGLDRLLENQKKILKRLKELEDRTVPEWSTLATGAKLKGLSYETLRKHPEWQPDSAEARLVNGKRRWHREVILEWLLLDDDALYDKTDQEGLTIVK